MLANRYRVLKIRKCFECCAQICFAWTWCYRLNQFQILPRELIDRNWNSHYLLDLAIDIIFAVSYTYIYLDCLVPNAVFSRSSSKQQCVKPLMLNPMSTYLCWHWWYVAAVQSASRFDFISSGMTLTLHDCVGFHSIMLGQMVSMPRRLSTYYQIHENKPEIDYECVFNIVNTARHFIYSVFHQDIPTFVWLL